MNMKEGLSGPERGLQLLEVSRAATRMVNERINLERMGLRLVHLPLCPEDQANQIEQFFPRAKIGFAMAHKTYQVTPLEQPDLLKQAIPLIPKGETKIALTEKQNTLPEYTHVLAAMSYLIHVGRVSYHVFSEVPTHVDYQLGEMETFWHFNTDSLGELWETMGDLETIITASMHQADPLGVKNLLRIGHFFSAGTEISKIFDLD